MIPKILSFQDFLHILIANSTAVELTKSLLASHEIVTIHMMMIMMMMIEMKR